MPSQRFNTTILAGATNANILAGSQFEFLGVPSRVQAYMAGDTAAGVYNAEIFFGQELELADGPGPIFTAGFGPEVPEHLVLDDIGGAGDRIVVRLTETGGALAAIVRTLLVFTPIV